MFGGPVDGFRDDRGYALGDSIGGHHVEGFGVAGLHEQVHVAHGGAEVGPGLPAAFDQFDVGQSVEHGAKGIEDSGAAFGASGEAEVAKVLDAFHQAASKADGETYFNLFAPGGVFIGTDATERWTVEEFNKYAMPHFSKGKGWTYVPKKRNIALSGDAQVAWFDEILESESYGTCRGTGVLVRKANNWKVAQYHLTIPVPNDLAKQVVQMIRSSASR